MACTIGTVEFTMAGAKVYQREVLLIFLVITMVLKRPGASPLFYMIFLQQTAQPIFRKRTQSVHSIMLQEKVRRRSQSLWS